MQEYLGQPIDLKPFKITFIVCAALPGIFFLMTFVLGFMLSYPADVTELPELWMVAVFAVLAVVTSAAAPIVRARTLAATGPFAASYGVVLEGEPAAWQRIAMAATVGMAMPEISLLLGFVLGFQSMSWLYYIPFAALTIVGWAYMYPRPSQVRSWYARQMGYEHVPGMPL